MKSSNERSQRQPQKRGPIFPRKANPYLQNDGPLQRVQKISAGSFGEVDKYFNRTKKQFYAVKKMKFADENEKENIQQIQREIDLLYRVNSPYLVKLFDHFEDKEHAFLVMEYVEGVKMTVQQKNLCDGLYKPRRQLHPKILCQIIVDICQGLIDLHRNKIMHRDLKLENVMISVSGKVKIIDLGQSNFYGDGINRKTVRGTKPYFCPQILDREQQNDKVDVWCLGVIIYELICFNCPFRGATEKQMMENIRRFKYAIPEKIKYDVELLDLFGKIFTWKNNRISLEEIKNHEWIRKHTDQGYYLKYESLFSGMEVERYRNFLEEQINNYKQKLSNAKARNKDIKKEIDECDHKIYEIEQRMKETNKQQRVTTEYKNIYLKQIQMEQSNLSNIPETDKKMQSDSHIF